MFLDRFAVASGLSLVQSFLQAINIGKFKLMQILLRHKASPHHHAKDGTSPLMVACRQGQCAYLAFQPRQKSTHLTMRSVVLGHRKIVLELLMQDKPEPNHQAVNGVSALMVAARFGSYCAAVCTTAETFLDTAIVNFLVRTLRVRQCTADVKGGPSRL